MIPDELLESLKILGGVKFSNIVSILKDERVRSALTLMGLVPKGKGRYRKISYFPDKEDKVRVIAQLDYFSQSVLRPLHKVLYRKLRKLPGDCTHNQGNFFKILEAGKIFYSIDLSAATDRFPIGLIANLLKARFPEDYVNA
jgi:hypothetical protein